MRTRLFTPRGWPLWSKVSALLLLASLLPLLLFAALMLIRERAMLRAANVALLEARVDEVGHTLEAMYRAYRDVASRAARDPDVVSFCAGSPESRARTMGALKRHLDVARGDDPAIRGLGAVDPSGTVLAATEAPLVGTDFSHRKYFQRAVAGADAISDVYVSSPPTGRTPSVAFAAPVISSSGKVACVCVLWIRASALWEVMRAATGTAGRGSFFALFDRYGFRVGHGVNEKLLFHPSAPVPADVAAEMLSERRFQERTAELLEAVIPFPFHEIQGQGRRTFRRPVSPTNHVHNLAVARHFPEVGGTIVGHVPERELEVGLTTQLRRFFPAFLVALALVLAGGALLLRHVVWPIRRIAAAAAAVERGDLDLHEQEIPAADAEVRDEVGGLASAFRSMARSLADRDRALRERNRELERKQRSLITLSSCNEALVRASDERGLLQGVCDIVVREGRYRMCWVGFAEHDERKSVRPVAHAGHDEGYLSAVDIVWADTERGRGPVGLAVRTGKPVVTKSIASDPSFAPWVPEAIKRGYRSVAALPIVADGGVTIGALAIYATEVDVFDRDEMALLGELAADLAYGITALRGRAERLEMTTRLLQADRMVAVGTLAAGVAHEINNPLAYLVASLQFSDEEVGALEKDLPPGRLAELKRALLDAKDGARRVTTIVRDLKTFSRADEERSGAVDLHSVIDSALNIVINEIKHRARLVRQYGDVPPVLANEARLGQVFVNVLVNAAHAIADGRENENEIRVVTASDEHGRAVVEVRDTGAGMSPDVARHVFDPFFTTKPVGVGTGLGLFICHNIVSALGGEIAVESQPGSGTVVRVTLPPASGPPPGAIAQQAPCANAPHLRRGRILVIDDEPSVGTAIRRLLQPEHDVTVLTDARDARDRIAHGERFDAIICDIMMPVMTGMDLYDDLRRSAPEQADRMVVLTGGAFTPMARDFLERWPQSRLDKPVDSTELRLLIRTLVA